MNEQACILTRDVKTIPLSLAKKLLEAGEICANALGIPFVLSVTDPDGVLIAIHRMDDSLLISVSLSQKKAFTAVSLKTSTEEAAKQMVPQGPLYPLTFSSLSEYCFLGGGIPLFLNAQCIGAVGVSGGTPDEDMMVAKVMQEYFLEISKASS